MASSYKGSLEHWIPLGQEVRVYTANVNMSWSYVSVQIKSVRAIVPMSVT